MRRLTTWEGHPFQKRSAPQATTVDPVAAIPSESHGVELPPILPPLRLMDYKQPLGNIFGIVTTRLDTGHVVIPESPIANGLSPNTSCSPQSHSPSWPTENLTSVGEFRTSNDVKPTVYNGRHVHRASRHSSLSHSKASDGSPPPSRPSSKSSLDECISLDHRKIQQSPSDASSNIRLPASSLSIQSSRILALDLLTNRYDTYPNKPLSTTSTMYRSLVELPREETGSPTIIHSPTATTPKLGRGARLGRRMVEGMPAIQIPVLISSQATQRSRSVGAAEAMQRTRLDDVESRPRCAMEEPRESIQRSFFERNSRIPSSVIEQIVLRILLNLTSLSDLQSSALVSKSFYRIFRKYERDLVNHVLFASSAPAWELRQILRHERQRNAFRLKAVQQDLGTIHALQSFILMKCQSICRPSTIEAFLDKSSTKKLELDDALWRIWTFCKLFGKCTGRGDLRAQVLWLDGGNHQRNEREAVPLGVSNGNGITSGQLEDISEMWLCLDTLLSGFIGREAEARRAGVYDQCILDKDAGADESYFLSAWLQDLLSLGPKTVLSLSCCSFEQAKILGLTKWTPPQDESNRSGFLKAALEEVYRERLITDARHKAAEFERQLRTQPVIRPVAANVLNSRRVIENTTQSLKINTTQPQCNNGISQHSSRSTTSSPAQRSHDLRSPTAIQNSFPLSSPVTNSAAFSSLAMTPKASVKLGSSLFPVHNEMKRDSQKHNRSEQDQRVNKPVRLGSTVIDPVDKAMTQLVKEMGFPENRARQALAMCDNGGGIDLQKAIDMLTIDAEPNLRRHEGAVFELPAQPVSPSFTIEDFGEKNIDRTAGCSTSQRSTQKRWSKLNMTSFRKTPQLDAILDTEEGRHSTDNTHIKRTLSANYPVASGALREDPSPTAQNLLPSFKNSLHPRASLNKSIFSTRGASQGSAMCQVQRDCGQQSDARGFSPTSPNATLSVADMSGRATFPADDADCDHVATYRPRVTLTRVGTGKKPGRVWSFKEGIKKKEGEPPEIIGYTY